MPPRVAGLVALTKPRIIELLLITTVSAMFVASSTVPSFRLVALTVLGGTCAAGGAHAFNMFYDRDIDSVMDRTRRRPLDSGAVTGHLSLAAWLMFVIVFAWTPPHPWALAMRYRDDYSRASVPMLPSVTDLSRVVRQILVHTSILSALAIALGFVAHLGWVFFGTANAREKTPEKLDSDKRPDAKPLVRRPCLRTRRADQRFNGGAFREGSCQGLRRPQPDGFIRRGADFHTQARLPRSERVMVLVAPGRSKTSVAQFPA